MTDFRESMITDLILADTLSELNSTKLIEILGEPESIKGYQINYLFRKKQESDIDPVYIKYLEIEIDTTVNVLAFQIEQTRQ